MSYAGSCLLPGGSLRNTLYGRLNDSKSLVIPSTREGMTKDLESFKRVGIGGIVYYDQVHGDQLPNTELSMSKEWWDNIYYIAKETKRLELDFEFHVSNGFVAGVG